MKTLSVYKRNDEVRIDVEIDLDNRKSQLSVNNKQVEKRFTNLLDKVKKFSKFNDLSLSYNEKDYYDNVVNVYETPYIHFKKGTKKRKPTISSQEHGCIPKDWSEVYSLTLQNHHW